MPATSEIDPVVQEQLTYGETVLAEFMDGLSKTVSRYNTLLAKALPQNPKAHFYYYNEDEKKDAEAAKAGEDSTSSEKKIKTEDGSTSAAPTEEKPKNPTSPLLRRPQLHKEELEKIKVEAKEELMRRQSSVGDFPMVGEEERAVKAHTNTTTDKAKKHAAHHTSHVHGHVKKHHKSEGDKEEEGQKKEEGNEEAEKKLKKKSTKKEPKSLLPSLFENFGSKKKDKKKDNEEKQKEESPKVILTEAEAAADNDEWEDETDDEAGEEMTVQQLFEKIAPSPQLLQEVRVIKNEARDLSLKFEIIHDWIAMNLPALATEDTSGTEVMGSIIEALMGFMSTVEDIYATEATYLAERAELELEFLQNPEIATGLARIAILDNDTWDSIEVGYRALIRCYLIAHSQLAKNMESLRTPIRRRVNLSM